MAHPEVSGKGTALADGDRYLTGPQVRARYGDVSDMWIHRRLHDNTGFPPPDLIVNGRRFWRLSALVAWERTLAAGTEHDPSRSRRLRINKGVKIKSGASLSAALGDQKE